MNVRFKVLAAAGALVTLGAALLVVVYAQRTRSGGEGPYRGPPATPGSPAMPGTPGMPGSPGAPGSPGLSRSPGTSGGSATRPGATRHIALNAEAHDFPRLRALGYDLVDVKPDDWSLGRVPDGMGALLWVGNSTCGPFELAFEEFTAAVRRLARHPKVYGWYLSDEPDPGACPQVAGEIRRRADYIRRYAPGQFSFVLLTDWEPMRAVAPARTGVDLVGLDPYPCERRRPGCDIGQIDRMVRMADKAAIPRRMIVPVFQTFGQSCSGGTYRFRLPTEEQLRAILRRWYRIAPTPPMEVSYSWGRQRKWACPTLADANGRAGLPDLQSVMKEHNGR